MSSLRFTVWRDRITGIAVAGVGAFYWPPHTPREVLQAERSAAISSATWPSENRVPQGMAPRSCLGRSVPDPVR